MIIAKYFWDLNEKSLKEAEKILKSPKHPQFITKAVTFLSRCDKPEELFSILPKEKFVEIWPKVSSYWIKRTRESDYRDWWETIYEQLLEKYQLKQKNAKGKPAQFLQKFGVLIKEARIKKGLSQRQLALSIGMKQPDISGIEDGRKNITLYTLLRLCKILEIKKIDMD